MLKYVNPAKLRKSTKYNINVKTFPGAKVEDMKYYVKLALAKAPDQLILHVGYRNNRHRMRDDDESCLHFFTVRALLNAPY